LQNRRWDADYLTVRSLVTGGALGEVALLQLRWDRWRPSASGGWKEDPDTAGDIFSSLASHMFDQVRVGRAGAGCHCRVPTAPTPHTCCNSQVIQLFGVPEWVQGDLLMQRPGTRVVDGFEVC
jgi:hypothetical protein